MYVLNFVFNSINQVIVYWALAEVCALLSVILVCFRVWFSYKPQLVSFIDVFCIYGKWNQLNINNNR